ncbi:hypothetical protein LI328DRAFT_6855 [Trichoderma asperelloides]|nr:hypothetical protein LI328DRAFT_6855 [Trichoderma asperelloides]
MNRRHHDRTAFQLYRQSSTRNAPLSYHCSPFHLRHHYYFTMHHYMYSFSFVIFSQVNYHMLDSYMKRMQVCCALLPPTWPILDHLSILLAYHMLSTYEHHCT